MWNGISKEDLDKAYNNSLAVANSAELISAWSTNSEHARSQLGPQVAIPYGAGSYQAYDFFSAGAGAPLLVFIHGGFWQNRSRSDFSFIAPQLVYAGISVAILGYTLAPHASIDQIVDDIKSGISAIHNEALKKSNLHKGIWLVGWSAGAHLVAMTLGEPCVLGGTAISGIYDLEPMRHCYINDKLNLDEQSSLRNSPILLKNHFGKVLDLFVGDTELPEMFRQTINFSKYRERFSQPGAIKVLKGHNHYSIFDELIKSNGEIYTKISKRVLKI